MKLVPIQRKQTNLTKLIQKLVKFDEGSVKDLNSFVEEEDLVTYCAIQTSCESCIQLFDRYPVVPNNVKVGIGKPVLTLIEDLFESTGITTPHPV